MTNTTAITVPRPGRKDPTNVPATAPKPKSANPPMTAKTARIVIPVGLCIGEAGIEEPLEGGIGGIEPEEEDDACPLTGAPQLGQNCEFGSNESCSQRNTA